MEKSDDASRSLPSVPFIEPYIDHLTTMFLDLIEDAQLRILSFLGLAEVPSVLSTCHVCCDLVLRSTPLWEQWCRQRWPHLSPSTVFVEHDGPAPSPPSSRRNGAATRSVINNKPSPANINTVHTSARFYQLLRIVARGQQPVQLDASNTMANSDWYTLQDDNTVQYVGDEMRDFSLRVNIPLPKPRNTRESHLFVSPYRVGKNDGSGSSGKAAASAAQQLQDNDTVVVTPRHMAYFEITLLPPRPRQPPSRDTPSSFRENRLRSRRRRRLLEGDEVAWLEEEQGEDEDEDTQTVVGIGLATKHCNLRRRPVHLQSIVLRHRGFFPGWDDQSFGYHGDDGNLFFGSGIGSRVEGFSTYGVGDTVGCGVDYLMSSIFFTLNGKLLGHRWDISHLIQSNQDLYPVVGAVRRCPISINLGHKSFMFDPYDRTASSTEPI